MPSRAPLAGCVVAIVLASCAQTQSPPRVERPIVVAAAPAASVAPAQAIAVGPPTNPLPDANTVEVPPAGACHMSNGLPDRTCTPGLLNPDLTTVRLCAVNFSTKRIRPPRNYTDALKRRLMVSYGLTDPPASYELDHLVSLEDQGHPWSPKNLWPMPRGKSSPGDRPTGVTLNTAEEKDQVETALHRAICATPSDTPRIADLQFRLATDWTQIKRIPSTFGVDLTEAPPKEEPEP